MQKKEPDLRRIIEGCINKNSTSEQLLYKTFYGYIAGVAFRYLREREMIKELNTQNSKLLAGTDCPNPWLVPGLSLHQELQQLVLAGLTNYEALKTATINPAIWFGGNYNKGTLEQGKQADLIILTDNPLTDIKNTQKIKFVIYKGKVIDREK